MIRIVDGKRYNSDKAVSVAEWDNGYGSSDFKGCEETLYRTAKGAFFLVGSGGPLSVYSVSVSGGRTGGSRLTVYTEDQAFNWLVSVNAVDALEKYFPDRLEDA